MNKEEVDKTIDGIVSSKQEAPTDRDEKGRFPKGVSGNPAGKAKGTKNRTTILKQAIEQQLTEQLEVDATEILQTAITLAKSGDTSMLKVLLDKMLPNRKGDEVDMAASAGGIQINITTTHGRDEDSKIIEAEKIEED